MKQSIYNTIMCSGDKVDIYNTLSNGLINVSLKEYDAIFKNILINPNNGFKIYPTLCKSMKDLGFIVNQDFDELEYVLKKNKEALEDESLYHVTINPTLMCNFKCWYCSVSTYVKDDDLLSGKMEEKTLLSIVEHFDHVLDNNAIKEIKIDWFGGEPLMYFDEIVKNICYQVKLKAEIKGVKFSSFVTTNAYYINKSMISDFISLNINNFQITLDGNENRHNKIRNEKGRNSYGRIVNNVKSLIKYHTESTVILRINYDKKTIYGLKDILSNFDFVDKNRIIFDFQKVWQVDLSDTDKELLANGIDLFVKQGFNILTPEYRPNKWTSCYANRNNYKVFNYNGEIFKCTARDYSNDIKIGHVLDNVGSKSNTIYETYKLLNLSDFKECLACNILPICNGPCIQKMFEFKASEDIKFIDICLLSRYKSKDDYLKKHIKLLKK